MSQLKGRSDLDMDKIDSWKNFNLGTELEISGTFIYNALKLINETDDFQFPEIVFEILYDLSIGIERLEKIAIILIEFKGILKQVEFEKTLKTHNHCDLLIRIQKCHNLKLNNSHIEFINLLEIFYKKNRYYRFNLNHNIVNENDLFMKFIRNRLDVSDKNFALEKSKNTLQIKFLLSEIIGKIVEEIYTIIYYESKKINLLTYELRNDGKAYNIFINKDYTFMNEMILKKEIIINLINNSNSNFIKLIKNFKSLKFDVQDENEMIDCLLKSNKSSKYYDELESLYDSILNKEERFEMLNIIGKKGIEIN